MQLSVSSGKNGLIQRATFLAFGTSTDHTSDWPLADVVVSLNRWYHRAATWLWQSSGTWEFDDSNQTTANFATATLVGGQQDYALPTTAFAITRVEVLDASGNYQQLRQIDQTEVRGVALSEYYETDGLPIYYDVSGASLHLYPAPAAADVTTALGLKIYVAREISEFSTPASYTTADTTQPGFEELFHEILCFGAAYDWCITNGPQERAQAYRAEIEAMKQDMFKHQGMKNKDKKVSIQPRMESYN